MRLKTFLFSQRDNQWKNILLGFNTNPKYNIGNYGCLITSFGNYIGKTPEEINNILKSANGFVQGSGNFIWSKCTALGLNQTYVSPEYTGPVTPQGIAKIKECLENNFPLICKIDFNPATTQEETHFVLICGYEGDKIYATDPWTGQVIDLDIYGGPTRAIIQFRSYDKKLEREKSTQEQERAFRVITEAYNNLPDSDILKQGNLEGYCRAIVEEHKIFSEYERKAKQLDGFIAKWIEEFKLPVGSNLVEIETEMTKLLPLEDKVNELRDAIEQCVGKFENDDALLTALRAVKQDKDKLAEQLAECQLKLSNKKVLWAFKIGEFTVKIYKGAV